MKTLTKNISRFAGIALTALLGTGSVFAQAPANDNCAGAISLTPGTSCSPVTGTVANATQTVTGCLGTANDDVWYSFVATSSSHNVVVVGASSFDAVLQVMSGSCPSGTSLACRDASGSAGTETATLTGLTVGATYFARVYHYFSAVTSTPTFTICVTTPAPPPPPPANDNCSGAISLTPSSTCNPVNGTTASATQSQSGCAGTADDDVWYSFVANSTSAAVTVTGASSFDAVVQVFSGACGTLTSLVCEDLTFSGGTETAFVNGLTIGNTYYARVYTWSSSAPTTPTFSICVVATAPAPDPCVVKAGLACGSTKSFSLAAGAGAGWNNNGPFSTPGSEQVYQFTATTTGAHQIAISHAGGGYVDLFVSTACSPTGWTYLDDILGSATNSVSLVAGTTYFFLIDDENTTATNGTITMTCPPPVPPCQLATGISCGQTLTGTTVGGTPEPSLPTCSGFSVGTGGGRWYKFTGTGAITTASLCDAATNYDSRIHVFSGSCTSPVCVIADDDDCSSPGLASTVTWCAASGTTYYIFVNGYLGNEGAYSLSIDCNGSASIDAGSTVCLGSSASLSGSPAGGTFSGPGVSGSTFSGSAAGVGTHTVTYTVCGSSASTTYTVVPGPGNDLCANAISISAGNNYSGTNVCATADNGLSFCGTSQGSGGVWYTFTGDGNRWNIETCNANTNFDTKLHVFTGSCSANTCVTGNDDIGSANCTTGPGTAGFKSQVNFCTTIGATYYVLVSGFGSASGNFEIEVTSTPGPSVNAGANQIVYTGYAPAASCATLTAVGTGVAPLSYNWSNGATGATITVCPTVTTDYTVTVTDANGCQGTDVVRVCVVDLACGKDKIYVCHIPPGNPNNSQTLCISVNAVQQHVGNHGDYYGPCGSNVCNDGGSVGKAEASAFAAELTASPNPFQNNTTIAFSSNTDERVVVKVYSMLGAEVATLFDGMMASGEQQQVNFRPEGAAAGMYMVKMSTASGKNITKRIVME